MADTANDKEFEELLGFLQDPKPEVQRFAAEGVLGQTESQDFLGYCQRNPRLAAKPLLRLAEKAEADLAEATKDKGAGSTKEEKVKAMEAAKAEATGSFALQALVNLSQVPTVRDELVNLSAPRRCLSAVREGWLEGRAELAHWYGMVLANITTVKAGQEALCTDEGLLRFLFATYVTKPRPEPRDGYDDPLIFLGKVLRNIVVLSEGRAVLAGGETGPGILAKFVAELSDRGRRPDVLGILRNICLDTETHKNVVKTDLLPALALFVYPLEKVDAASREALPEALRQTLEASGATLIGDIAVRLQVAELLLALARTGEGRQYLRDSGGLEVTSAWAAEESQDQVKANLEATLQAIRLSEEDFLAEMKKAQEQVAEESKDSGKLAGLLDDS